MVGGAWGWKLRRGASAKLEGRPDDEECADCSASRAAKPFALTGSMPPAVVDTDVPVRDATVLDAVVDDQIVIVHPRRVAPHVLNTSAGLVWQAIDGRSDAREIALAVAEATGSPVDQLAIDVRNVIAELRRLGMVCLETDPHGSDGSDDFRAATGARRRLRALLDELDWPSTIGPVALGAVDVVVRTNDDSLATNLRELLADLVPGRGAAPVVVSALADDTPAGRRYRLYVDARRVWTQLGPSGMADVVLSELNLVAATRTRGHTVLHAGAVERDGKAIVLAGHSGRGKSTLTAALVERGYRYLTDEAAAIDITTMWVAPYPKPLSLSGDSARRLGLDHADPSTRRQLIPGRTLGTISSGGELALIVVLSGPEDEMHNPTVEPESPVGFLLSLIRVAFASTFKEPTALDPLASMIERGRVMRLDRMDIAEACDLIDAAFCSSLSPGSGVGPTH